MDERINQVAALANVEAYDEEATKKYIDGAPHVKHASLRQLYGELVVRVHDTANQQAETPSVLDLGAGEGSATLPFLELGAKVTAVDISNSQLEKLKTRCEKYGERLEVRCEDINVELAQTESTYDVVVMNAFLHHVPDYLGLIRQAASVIKPRGQFFSFQDPLRYDTLGALTIGLSRCAYLSWRIFDGDVIGGLKRRYRRSRGIYLQDSVHDNAEYHVTRNGVDQNAIKSLFDELDFDCQIIRYFSTQSRLFQRIGAGLGMQTSFGVIAQKRA